MGFQLGSVSPLIYKVLFTVTQSEFYFFCELQIKISAFYSRDPKSIVKPLSKNATDDDVHKYNEKLQAAKPKAVRHLILIRHGQYNLEGLSDDQRYLTEIGKHAENAIRVNFN